VAVALAGVVNRDLRVVPEWACTHGP
jgi:hypothetical protein